MALAPAATEEESQTQVAVLKEEDEEALGEPPQRLMLRLEPRPHITFSEDTIDNEHMNKKSSKRCCIYHKRRDFGESSTESDSSDDDCDCGEPHDAMDQCVAFSSKGQPP